MAAPKRSSRSAQRGGYSSERAKGLPVTWVRGHPTRTALVGLAVLAALAAYDGWRLQRLKALNEAVAAGRPPPPAADDGPELRFAHAWAQAASGAADGAINAYGALQSGSGEIARAARYNAANLLIRQALALRERQQPGQALALVELAKEHYRDVLRANPDDWHARYNLERAQRLVPDPAEAEEEPPETRRNAERAATTMRGYSPGLP
jgi:mxaK protein